MDPLVSTRTNGAATFRFASWPAAPRAGCSAKRNKMVASNQDPKSKLPILGGFGDAQGRGLLTPDSLKEPVSKHFRADNVSAGLVFAHLPDHANVQ